MVSGPSVRERRGRSVDGRPTGLFVSVGVLTALAWGYLLFLGSSRGAMDSAFAMPMTSDWSWIQALQMVAMWAVMMVAMKSKKKMPRPPKTARFFWPEVHAFVPNP